ncbi:hypothetical protein [Actinomycetospora sp. CA-084318]|uniref:hypothetical protein n=1 Tax=Actinomycetospora sp. CA-084318 TaxID=3239892 RepID=UPI003D969DB1
MDSLLVAIVLFALLAGIGCLFALITMRIGDRSLGSARVDRQRALEETLAAEWLRVGHLIRSRPELAVIEVGRTYQRARRGSKAFVRWMDSGSQQDTWFWHDSWPEGALLVVSPSVGWGPHNRNPEVLYLEKERVIRSVDRRAPAAAAAVERRRREQHRAGEAA